MSMESRSTKSRRRKPPDVFPHLVTRALHDHLGLMEPRPFFYPVLLGLNLVLGEFAVLVSQVLLWFLSGNLIFLGLQRLTGKTSWAIAGLSCVLG